MPSAREQTRAPRDAPRPKCPRREVGRVRPRNPPPATIPRRADLFARRHLEPKNGYAKLPRIAWREEERLRRAQRQHRLAGRRRQHWKHHRLPLLADGDRDLIHTALTHEQELTRNRAPALEPALDRQRIRVRIVQ